ncbi:GIY-YIG nuclease family protein [Patescibacteria group bacterium]|nr:GIY-YIG nuclease family protein [Patescibacteria group bacterium]
MTYYFYLARCSDNSLYCGSCKDLQKREEAHNEGKGAKYTRSRRPIHFAYHETFTTLSDALKRESEVKKWSKVKKERLAQEKHSSKD